MNKETSRSFLGVILLVVVPLGGCGDKVLGLVADGQVRGAALARRAGLEHANQAANRQS